MKKTIITIIITVIGISTFSFAQSKEEKPLYNTAGGFRLVGANAVSLKHFFKENLAVEVYAGSRWLTMPTVGATLQYFKYNMFGQEALGMFFGGGAHFVHIPITLSSNAYLGIDAIFGFEYDFTELIDFPVAASVDVMGGLDFNGNNFLPAFPGPTLSVRYIFKQ
jgi:hypothetical protein